MGRLAESTIRGVQERLDAIAVVEGYVRLEKRAGRYWGRCPFHGGGRERTPSMKVDPDRKLFHCFGCGKGGGIIAFVMEMDGTGFPETIMNLARRFGVPVEFEGGGDAAGYEAERARRDQLLELYRRTAVKFSHFLLETAEGRPALDYILGRGLDEGAVRRFRLGYSPADRGWLHRFLLTKGFSPEFLGGSGLFAVDYPGMAFFSGRLMFPIADRQGRTVAFGGRALPGAAAWKDGREPPKYVNSRESDIYAKGQVLYGLDTAIPGIRATKTAYLAEGYMDVIALHSAGVVNAVAPCGTALTDDQARLLRNHAETAVLVFDSDEAGMAAAEKAVLVCRRNGLSCSVVAGLADAAAGKGGAKDPAEMLLESGAEALKGAMGSTIMDFEYLLARGRARYDVSAPKGKALALSALHPYLDALGSRTERDACIEAAADALRADRASARADYADRKPDPGRRNAGRDKGEEAGEGADSADSPNRGAPPRMNDEVFLLTLVALNTDLYPRLRARVGIRDAEDPAAKELFVALEECFAHGEEGTEALLARVTWEALRAFVAERGVSGEFSRDAGRDLERMVDDGVRRLELKKRRRRLAEIAGELRAMERESGGDDGFQELIDEKIQLDMEIRGLERK